MEETFCKWAMRFWWTFPLASVLVAVGSLYAYAVSIAFGIIVLCFSAILLFIQYPIFFVLLSEKKWWRAIGSFLAGVINFATFAFIVLVFCFADNFGRNHPIPEGLEYNKPLGNVAKNGDTIDAFQDAYFECVRVQPTIDSADTASWLQIWNDYEKGDYKYTLYWSNLDDGEVYLRCFEVTENIELSKERINTSTTTQVSGHNDFGQVVNQKEFTIYEGEWGDYYAVRVEVWHKPTNGDAHKLMEKVYRMEGWMN